MLLDIDLKENKNFVDEIFNLITLAPLKVSTFFKMNYYLAFKAYKNPEIENYFKIKVQEAKMRLDDKTDTKRLNKYLSIKQKTNIARKQNDR